MGEPNVGKSSLFNRLLSRERSIVSPVAGTTRDTVEGELSAAGIRLTLVDTAGVRETENEIEEQGVKRTRETFEEADVALLVYDARDVEGPEKLAALNVLTPYILVANKADLITGFDVNLEGVHVSATTGLGIDRLLQRILSLAQSETLAEDATISSVRQQELFTTALTHVKAGLLLLRAPPARILLFQKFKWRSDSACRF